MSASFLPDPGTHFRQSYGELVIDGRRYDTLVHMQMEMSGWGPEPLTIRTEPPTMRAAHICEHCHRFDVVEVVATSFDEAVEFGWLVPIGGPT